jgi:uncharacterized protein YndB with AHSA1/START domain
MNINRQAPVVARQSVIVSPPVDAVWRLLTDIDRWPRWNPDIRRAELRGSPVQNAVFYWELGGWSISSRVHEVIPLRKFAWSGQAGDVVALHVWTFAPIADGVRVQAEESWEGASLTGVARHFQRAVNTSLGRWLAFLKDDVEDRARFVQYVMHERDAIG